jgi:thiol-disulfide isomerase/thioredoxin
VVHGYLGWPALGKSQLWTRVGTDGSARSGGISAPEFAGIERWLNSEPLTLRALRGKVVLVDFWTLACGNCIATLPHVAKWDESYRGQGLVVIGVHTPETAEEAKPDAIANAVKRFGIRYPVAEDGAYATWKAYGNHYWPAVYLIDSQGRIAQSWFGEGSYHEIEASIRALLSQARRADSAANELR